MRNILALILFSLMAACAAVPEPVLVGEIGRKNKTWVQIVDVDTYPAGGICRAPGNFRVSPQFAYEDNVFNMRLRTETLEISCAYEDGTKIDRAVSHTLNQETWSKAKDAAVAGAFIGGGLFGALGAATASPNPPYYSFPIVLNVVDAEQVTDSNTVEELVSAFSEKWDNAVAALAANCIRKGGKEEDCNSANDQEFLGGIKEAEIEYLMEFLPDEPSMPQSDQTEAETAPENLDLES